MDAASYFRDKRITVLGLGLLGRGVGDVEFLAQKGAELTVTDLKTEKELAASLERLKRFPGIHFVLGEHRLEDFRSCDFVLKAAGVPLDSPYIEEAKKHSIPIEMSTALAAELSGAQIVGITGTRGKSTVTHMIYEVLKKESERGAFSGNVFLGGNVRGVSTLALLDEMRSEDTLVLELDSWQLQGFHTRKLSPHISVFTTFMPDHMNYYKNDMRVYFFDKSAIFAFQKERDILVLSAAVKNYIDEYGYAKPPSAMRVVSDTSRIPKLIIPGEHNRLNAALALEAMRAVGVDEAPAHEHLSRFGGVPGRLERIAEKNGKIFFNDTTATTPQAAEAALRALSEYDITLIAGGSDKGLDFKPFIELLAGSGVTHLILLPGTGTDRLIQEGGEQLKNKAVRAASVEEAVRKADDLTKAGGVVLLSPGCASFGLFENEFDRGDQFVREVTKI
jgi:UDP-N-acetylmuramoylalanine--D-glutamate ligase